MGEGKTGCKIFTIICVLFLAHLAVNAQEAKNSTDWDNQFFAGNKVVYGVDKWKYSGELQFRMKDDFQALDRWYIEGVVSYLLSKYWEFVPDFRFSVKSSSVEYRPGFGVLFKVLSEKWQFVNQVKYQADINSTGTVGHGIRHVIFLNHILSEKVIPNIVAGYFYRWRENFSGFEFIRLGAGINIIFDPVHTLNISYFLGSSNSGDHWAWSGIAFMQLSIRIREDWLYVPAKYINF